MKKNRFLSLLLTISFTGIFVLTGCGNSTTNKASEEADESDAIVAQTVENNDDSDIDSSVTPYFNSDLKFAQGTNFNIPFAVATCEPEEKTMLEYKGVAVAPVEDENIELTSIVFTDDEDPDYQDVQIDMTIKNTFRLTVDYYEYDEKGYYVNCQTNFLKLIDYYTGETMPYMSYDSKAPGYDFTKVINYDGKSYTISYSVVSNSSTEEGDWEADENDTEARYEYYDTTMTHDVTMYFKIPKDYNGLMLYAKNNNLNFDDQTYYENSVADSTVLFDDSNAGNIDDYMFIRVSDLQ